MFRKKPKNPLKEMEEWPTTLDGYGLYINEKDQVRLLHKPEEKMIYRISNSIEYNDRRLAAFRRVLSNIAIERIEELGMRKMNLPLGTPDEEPHTVIFVSQDFEMNKEKVVVLIPFADELGMWASRVVDEETIHSGSLEDATKEFLGKGYAIVVLNPKQNYWDTVRKTQLSQTEMRFSRRKFIPVEYNTTSVEHIQYVMDKVMTLSPAKGVYIFSHWGSCYEILDYLNLAYEEKYARRLTALGMAQGTFPMEYITNAKFRIFLAEKAINYLHVANAPENILVANTNIGCPNISFGPNCDLYEFMATRTLGNIIRFFEEGQSEVLKDIVIEDEPVSDDELNKLGYWDESKEKMETGNMEKLLEVGIGTGADDSEWFRVK